MVVKSLFTFMLLSFCVPVYADPEGGTELAFNAVFSEDWMERFGRDKAGCSGPAKHHYHWRHAGYGSNINLFLLTWASSIVRGDNDVSIILHTEELFARTTCTNSSNGVDTRGGWPCIFSAVPHLCAFDTPEDWVAFNRQRGLSKSQQDEASTQNTAKYALQQKPFIEESLADSSVDIMGALAALYEYLNSHLTPWFVDDVQEIMNESEIAALRGDNYVSMHIRRTDKEVWDHTPPTDTTEYFENIAVYLNSSSATIAANEVKGLWLSSDDSDVFHEVVELAPKFFPNISPEGVVFVSHRVFIKDMSAGDFAEGALTRNTYEAMVLLRVELLMLAGADVFSGTLSSNLGRVVALMRRTLKKPEDSTLSADVPKWHAGRK